MAKLLIALTIINIGVAVYVVSHPDASCPPALQLHSLHMSQRRALDASLFVSPDHLP